MLLGTGHAFTPPAATAGASSFALQTFTSSLARNPYDYDMKGYKILSRFKRRYWHGAVRYNAWRSWK